MTRKYELKQRAQSQAETRQRIAALRLALQPDNALDRTGGVRITVGWGSCGRWGAQAVHQQVE